MLAHQTLDSHSNSVIPEMDSKTVLDLVTIVKFYFNNNRKMKSKFYNRLLTRTLGKVGVIDRKFDTDKVQSGEFWKVRIVGETCPGRNTGCFLLEPIEKVLPDNMGIVLPGMYSEQRHKGLLIVHPNSNDHNWMMGLKHRKAIQDISDREVYAIIVDLS